MNNWRSFTNREQLDAALAEQVADRLRSDLEAQERVSMAVSGGGTPKGMFEQLSCCELDWARVDITLVDERWVDLESPDSNEQLVRGNLLKNNAANANMVSMTTGDSIAEAGLAEVTKRIEAMTMPFSVVILGMGGDGHTASWFPQASNLEDLLNSNGNSTLGTTDPVTAPHQRITLTFPSAMKSHNIFIHITGQEKKNILETAVDNGLPIGAVLEQTVTPVDVWWAP